MTAATRDPSTGRFTRSVPAVVIAGGLTWTAAEHATTSPIGFELACRRGTPAPARDCALATRDIEAELAQLAKAATA